MLSSMETWLHIPPASLRLCSHASAALSYLDVGDDRLQVMLHALDQLLSVRLARALDQHLLLQAVLLELQVGDEQVQAAVGLVVPAGQRK